MKFTEDSLEKMSKLKTLLASSDAIIIGAGAGLSASAGMQYSGKRFERLMPEFIKAYKLTDMYSAAFYPYPSSEEFWAYFSKHIYYNRYQQEVNSTYSDLLALVTGKNYFVITTNVDHLFQKSGFDKKRLFYTQGDYGLFQCSLPCHDATYDNKEVVFQMVKEQANLKIPSSLIPHCPRCNREMTTNLRKDSTFVQDEGWYLASNRYVDFINKYKEKKIVFLELGIGYNTPSIIKYPFWQMTLNNKDATYISINNNEIECPKEIKTQSILFQEDIHELLLALRQ